MVSAISKRSNNTSSTATSNINYNSSSSTNNNNQETPSSAGPATTSSVEQPFFTNPSLIHFNSVQVICAFLLSFFLFV